MTEVWREVGDRVYVRRHRSFDLNVGLVVGADRCLVVDTRMSHEQARELVAAVREITPHPWMVVNTHAHFDHFFGNAVFRPAQIWGHRRCAQVARDYGEVQRSVMVDTARRTGETSAAEELRGVRVDPPDRTFDDRAELDVGGRVVHLRHLGRGHTNNDIVVLVPDAGTVFAGDLVEEGAPPSFDDAFPLDWPDTVGRLLSLVTGPVVPGHGAVVDHGYVEVQAARLARTAELARLAAAEGRDVETAWRAVPFPEEYARTALRRAARQLRGAPEYDSPQEVLAAAGLR